MTASGQTVYVPSGEYAPSDLLELMNLPLELFHSNVQVARTERHELANKKAAREMEANYLRIL